MTLENSGVVLGNVESSAGTSFCQDCVKSTSLVTWIENNLQSLSLGILVLRADEPLRTGVSGTLVNEACSSFLSIDSQPQPKAATLDMASPVLRELCTVVTEILQKPQEQNERDNTKRFLFHYSKTEKSGNSNIVSSVVHPLLQLVPQLHERRMKRFKENEISEEFQSPFAGQSRGYFLFRPRNGKRSTGFI
ncbi:neuromedin-U isoform X1 [Sigmodon hispidus]